MKPTLKQLEYFLAIIKYGSIRRAADALGISQPTLSAQLAKLEQIFKLNLFERVQSGTILSPSGQHLLPYVQSMIEDMNNLMDAVEIAKSGSKGVYRLGVTSTLGSYLLAYLLPEIHQQYPHLKFIVREDAPNILVEGLTEGRHDLVLIPLPLNNDTFHIETLIREELFIVMANDHPLATKSSITADDLVGEKVVNMEDNHLYSKQIDELSSRFGLAPLKDYQGTSLDALRAMVSTGVGIAFFPSLYVHSEIRAESNLHVMKIEGESIYRMHAIAWRHSSPARNYFRGFSVVFKELIKKKLGDVVEVM